MSDRDADDGPVEGEPVLTKTFASAKAHAHRLQKEKAQREAKEKSKAPPAASVPAKK